MRIHVSLKHPTRGVVADVDAADLDDVTDAIVRHPYVKVRQVLDDGTEAAAIIRCCDVQMVTQIDSITGSNFMN